METERKLVLRHTRAPWIWHRNGSKNLALCTPNRGLLYVMDFVRQGMAGAQPRFAVWDGEQRERHGGLMYKSSEIDLDAHPDARLIEAAPLLLEALKDLVDRHAGSCGCGDDKDCPCRGTKGPCPGFKEAEALLQDLLGGR